MITKERLTIFGLIVAGIVLALLILHLEAPTATGEHGEADMKEAEAAKGPHGGRLLSEGDFALEVTIYERGVPPQFRVYAYRQGKPLDPAELQLNIELRRLGAKPEPIRFRKESDYLLGDRVIEEPHSFDVGIIAKRQGHDYRFGYSQVEGRVRLDREALQSAGIEVKTAGPAAIKNVLKLPGEIQLDQNRLAHVVSRLVAVAVEVHKKHGETVKKGDVLAVLESRDLADLQSQYLIAQQRLESARVTFGREKHLWEAKISAEQDYLISRRDLAEAEIALEASTQKLIALGFARKEIKAIIYGKRQNLARYELRAPLDGVVIEKDIVQGEAVREDTLVFAIADLSRLWGEITVYARDLGAVRLGQTVTVLSADLGLRATGTVSHLDALVGEQTRSAKAHVDILNLDGLWRPGLFVTVEVQDEITVPVAVAAEAIQSFRDWRVVFAQYGDQFEVRPLELGRGAGEWVEVVKGLDAGTRYAARNSFVLKAELGKAGATHDH